jgi:hypothetical protein
MYIDLHEKYSLFLPDFNENCFSSTGFKKISNVKFHVDLSIGSRVAPCGETEVTKVFAVLQERQTTFHIREYAGDFLL